MPSESEGQLGQALALGGGGEVVLHPKDTGKVSVSRQATSCRKVPNINTTVEINIIPSPHLLCDEELTNRIGKNETEIW